MSHDRVGDARRVRCVVIATTAFLACVLFAVVLHAVVGSWGRDPRPASAFMAVLLALTSGYLAGWRRHPLSGLLAALLFAELILVAAIGWFAYGGLPQLDRFFYSWIVSGSLIIALPWLAGAAVGAWRARTHLP